MFLRVMPDCFAYYDFPTRSVCAILEDSHKAPLPAQSLQIGTEDFEALQHFRALASCGFEMALTKAPSLVATLVLFFHYPQGIAYRAFL